MKKLVNPIVCCASGYIFGCLFLSCVTKEHELEIQGYKPKLVINSLFCEGELFKVNISASKAISSTETYIVIENVEINLYENDQFVETLVWREEPFWHDEIDRGNYYSLQSKAKEGVRYRIEAHKTGFDPANAESIVPQKTPIYYRNHSWVVTDDYYADRWLRTLVEIENLTNLNYYYLFISLRFLIAETPRYILFRINDPVIGNYSPIMDSDYVLFNNSLMGGESYKFYIDIQEQSIPVVGSELRIYFHLATLSLDASLYLSSLTDQKNNDIRFSEPIIVHSNVANGAGIFAALNISTDSLIFSYD